MASVIAFDITRLFLGPLSRSPRGIDRVDLALARYLFADERSGNVGVLPTPWGVRTYDAGRVRRGIAFVSALWAEGGDGDEDDGAEGKRDGGKRDPRWPQLVEWLRTGAISPSTRETDAAASRWGIAAKVRRMAGELRATGFAFGQSVQARLPAGACYLNVGQLGLAVPAFHRWQARRPDVTVVTMLHDTIPIDHPEHVSASSVRHHRQMVRTAARHAHALIVTTEYARETVTAEMALCGTSALPTLVRKLPLPESFSVARTADPALAGIRYFVSCGTIEPRKNHALLLEVWRRLADRLGPATPRLALVGSTGFGAEAILRPLTDDARLKPFVTQVGGLSTAALARLMLGAAASLCPSLAEGFGLPLYEANALGVPTIASDIPSHREIADRATILLDPHDVAAWTETVLATPAAAARRTPALDPEIGEARYCRAVVDFLENSATPRREAVC